MSETTTVQCCLICDRDYVDQTIVAITSFAATKNVDSKYCFHVFSVDLSNDQEDRIRALAGDSVAVSVHSRSVSAFADIGNSGAADSFTHATKAALFKFQAPEILSWLDKVLYLDGDIVGLTDLHEIYDVPLSDHYAAVVQDSGKLYFNDARSVSRDDYFNSGVMLLNLDRMRRDHVPDKLVDARRRCSDLSLMDQNIFNLIFAGHVLFLPIRYNFMPVNLYRSYSAWSVDDVNGKYGTKYATKKDLFADAAIIHYSSREKPWKNGDVPYGFLWRKYWFASGLVGSLRQEKEPQGLPRISVIVDGEENAGFQKTLRSLEEQRFAGIEMIRSGSGPFSGLSEAKGEYVIFLRGGDFLCRNALAELWERAWQNDLDLILFEGDFSDESRGDVPVRNRTGRRKEAYPGVWTGKKLYAAMCSRHDIRSDSSLLLIRRRILLQPFAASPDCTDAVNDWLFVQALFAAGRCACFTDVFIQRKSSWSNTAGGKAVASYPSPSIGFAAFMVSEMRLHADNAELVSALLEHLFACEIDSRGTQAPYPDFGPCPCSLPSFLLEGLKEDWRRIAFEIKGKNDAIRKRDAALKNAFVHNRENRRALLGKLQSERALRAKAESARKRAVKRARLVENSLSFRIGLVMTWPLRKMIRRHRKDSEK